MEDRSKSMDAGMEFIYSGRPVGFSASFLTDTLNRSNGQELNLHLVTGAPIPDRGIILFGIGPKWMSENRVDYYYGVRPSEATDSRPAYAAPATWNLDISLTGILNISSRWRIFVRMNREGFGSGIKDSPIVDKSAAYSIISSLNYQF
jgi:outer membrane protein